VKVTLKRMKTILTQRDNHGGEQCLSSSWEGAIDKEGRISARRVQKKEISRNMDGVLRRTFVQIPAGGRKSDVLEGGKGKEKTPSQIRGNYATERKHLLVKTRGEGKKVKGRESAGNTGAFPR